MSPKRPIQDDERQMDWIWQTTRDFIKKGCCSHSPAAKISSVTQPSTRIRGLTITGASQRHIGKVFLTRRISSARINLPNNSKSWRGAGEKFWHTVLCWHRVSNGWTIPVQPKKVPISVSLSTLAQLRSAQTNISNSKFRISTLPSESLQASVSLRMGISTIRWLLATSGIGYLLLWINAARFRTG